jgi:hypothetical protein
LDDSIDAHRKRSIAAPLGISARAAG